MRLSASWCHFRQCPWDLGSAWAERAGQGEVGGCTRTVQTAWLGCYILLYGMRFFTAWKYKHVTIMIHPSKQWPNFYMALTETWQCKFLYVKLMRKDFTIADNCLWKSTRNWFRTPWHTAMCPTWQCAYLPSTVLIMASFQCTDSKPVCLLSTAIPVSTIMAANKEMKQVVDCMEWEEPY